MRISSQTVDASPPPAVVKEGNDWCRLISTSYAYHRAFIAGEIGEPKQYVELIHLLRSARPEAEIEVYVNSHGGQMDSALQIINAIRTCKAPVTTVLDGMAYSAGGLIFLSAGRHRVEPFASLMCHLAFNLIGGKTTEVKACADFREANFRRIASDLYSGFLTAKEMKLLLHGEDLWFDRDEIVRRLGKKVTA